MEGSHMKRGIWLAVVVVVITGAFLSRGPGGNVLAQATPGETATVPATGTSIPATGTAAAPTETAGPEVPIATVTPIMGGVLGQTPGAGASPAPRTLTLVERATTDTVIDLGEQGDSIGDMIAFGNALYDQDNQRQVGTNQGGCLRAVPGQTYECSWTVILANGQLSVEGPFNDSSDSVLTVTGGTGAYIGARGEMALHARNADGSEYDFTFTLI